MDKTVIVVTHEKHLVEEFDERVVTISKGCVVGDTKGKLRQEHGKGGLTAWDTVLSISLGRPLRI